MNNLTEKFETVIAPLADKLGRNRYLNAVKNGFISSMPLVIVGSFFLLLAFLPIDPYLQLMESMLGSNWQNYLLKVNDATMSCITLFVIFGCSSTLAQTYEMDRLSCIGIAVASYIILTPITDGTIQLYSFGANGLFLGLLTSLFSVEIVRFVKKHNWVIRMPATVPENISTSFSALIPAAITFLIFNFIRILFTSTSYDNALEFIYTLLQYPLMNIGSTLPAMILVIFIEMGLWSFGIHGSSVVGSVVDPILTALTVENANALIDGNAPSNIINSQFLGNFVRFGGAGATLGLAVLLLFFAKSKQYKTLGKLAIGPIAFQINEPLIFGLPIVLNPILIIPFILCPIILAIVCYVAFSIGLVPIINGINIPWTTPPLISGFLLCGMRGFLLQVFCLLISIGVYYPFFKIADNKSLELESEMNEENNLSRGELSND